jgi:hypothetical protein
LARTGLTDYLSQLLKARYVLDGEYRGRKSQRVLKHAAFSIRTPERTLDRLGFVQADPIRAPARAQDLILRHRVNIYRAGDLDRRFARLNVEEDVSSITALVTVQVPRSILLDKSDGFGYRMVDENAARRPAVERFGT